MLQNHVIQKLRPTSGTLVPLGQDVCFSVALFLGHDSLYDPEPSIPTSPFTGGLFPPHAVFCQSALLEEQKLVMQKCAAERQKLSTEWLELHTQQKLSKERTEREVDRALQMDSQREGTIMTLAKVQYQNTVPLQGLNSALATDLIKQLDNQTDSFPGRSPHQRFHMATIKHSLSLSFELWS